MKVKGLSNLDGRKTPYILFNIVFPVDMFYGFSLPGSLSSQSVSLAKIYICTNENLY